MVGSMRPSKWRLSSFSRRATASTSCSAGSAATDFAVPLKRRSEANPTPSRRRFMRKEQPRLAPKAAETATPRRSEADACPVKDEVYRVARRYAMPVKVVANAPLRVPADALVELVVCPGFGAADDWIAGQAGPGDVVVTADIPLAARCLDKGARVLGPKGHPFTENDIGSALALRE